ncbi:MAG: hypothetical protein QOE11_901 [Solirubrobacteraceae bacterium]|nr:hypothetical protein [Solirubrobacteraceae bacterium]
MAHPHDPAHERPTWQARLTGRGFEGSANANTHLGGEIEVSDGLVAEMICPESPWEDQLLHEYFDELYADRQGWDGERTWKSQLEHLAFTATHDYVNTVSLRVEVRGIADPPWLASVTLPLDPGVFHRIGANAKLFGDRAMQGAEESEPA